MGKGIDTDLVRKTVVAAMKRSKLSRAEIAHEMSRLNRETVTERQLNNFAAESRDEYRFPIELTRAFCLALNDWALLRVVTKSSGFRLVDAEEQKLIEIGRAFQQREQANKLLREARANG